jgi:Uma2 family endonuclease
MVAPFVAHPAIPRYTIDDLSMLPKGELLYGVFLVSKPGPFVHGILANRLGTALGVYCDRLRIAQVAMENAVVHETDLYFLPDVLVTPGRRPLKTPIRDFKDWLLVAEVLSPTTRNVDIGFKKDAYHALGVETVWLVDPDARTVAVTQRLTPNEVTVVTERLVWLPPGAAEPFTLALAELFRDD